MSFYKSISKDKIREAFLTRNYHLLCYNLRPNDFFTWLRTKNVFSPSDQEEVMRKEVITANQTGLLVDIIQKKGEAGFIAFMEVIEYKYPEFFSSLTGEVARQPPLEFAPDIGGSSSRDHHWRQQQVKSVQILGQMGDLVQTLSSAHMCNKEELTKLRKYVDDMQENISQEKAALFLQLKEVNEQKAFLEEEKVVLSEKLEKSLKEREGMSQQMEELRSLKDKYMKEKTTIGKLKDDLGNQVQVLEGEMKRFRVSVVPDTPAEKCPIGKSISDDSSMLQGQLSEAKRQNLISSFEVAQLESRLKDLQRKYQVLENNNAVTCREVMKERNLVIAQKRDLEEELTLERDRFKRLSSDFHKQMNKFSYMESKLVTLQKENEVLRIDQSKNLTEVPTQEIHKKKLPNRNVQLYEPVLDLTAPIKFVTGVMTVPRDKQHSDANGNGIANGKSVPSPMQRTGAMRIGKSISDDI